MDQSFGNSSDVRRVLQRDGFEVFHRVDESVSGIRPHTHDFYELYFPRFEEVDFVAEGHRYHLRPGKVVLTAPGQTHYYVVLKPDQWVEWFILWLDAAFVESVAKSVPRFGGMTASDLKGRNVLAPDPETYELMMGLFFSLLREKQGNEPDSASLMRLSVTQILIYVIRAFSRSPANPSGEYLRRHQEVMRVYEFISAHIKEPLSITDLAERFFMDKNTLTRQFKHVTGMTPGECIRRKRLEAAYAMITRGISVMESCHECGYTDYSAFYRAFRQFYGVSPRDCAGSPGVSHPGNKNLIRFSGGNP